jgi:hypothetical protein
MADEKDEGISKQDRADYEQGQRDSKLGVVEQAATRDIPVNHPDNSAYYKGRSGEQLDADKKEEKKAS